MNTDGAVATPGLWVTAIYPYESDDETSLSFKTGAIIQVLTQLESGWWDGVVNGQRGWFPSNYCELVTEEQALALNKAFAERKAEEAERAGREEDGYQTEPDTDSDEADANSRTSRDLASGARFNDDENGRDPEEASFWIPQVRDDGSLFYFNTLTRVTSTELPLESSQSSIAHGPRSSSFAASAPSRRHTTDMLGRAPERDDDTDMESEADDPMRSRGSLLARKRSSYVSDGASPATSMESLSMPIRPKQDLGLPTASSTSLPGSSPEQLKRSSSVMTQNLPNSSVAAIPARFLDYGSAEPMTWDSLLADIKASIESFRQAILKDERDEFVRKAEAVSDYVRLILAAGSGTTDNHSGNPSIITSNRALYPRFRDMMSRFARLVLDSHINAADYPPQDYSSKCLEDADNVLDGVYGFVEVARQQRGEEISRLFPGFVSDHTSGGHWQNNGLVDSTAKNGMASIENDDEDPLMEPNVRLDSAAIAQMDAFRKSIIKGMRDLEEHLVVKDKLISKAKHAKITRDVCESSLEIIELYKPWMTQLESITLAPLGTHFQTPQLADFAVQKQRVYNLVASLVMTCQAVGAPLADEWAQDRGEPLEDRVGRVRGVLKELEAATSRVNYSLQLLADAIPPMTAVEKARAAVYHQQSSSVSSRDTGRSHLSDISPTTSYSDANNNAAGIYSNSDSKKIQRIFGQVPMAMSPAHARVPSGSEKPMPEFLKLDFDREVVYDDTTDPATVKGGTLNGLIEQLTRHDTYQTNFRDTFLLTYQSFMNGNDLFEMLVQRWSIQAPLGLTEDEYALWAKEKQDPIRFRITNILKTWVGHYWMEEENKSSQYLLQKIYNFVQDMQEQTSESAIRPLMTVVEQRMKGVDPSAARRMTATFMEGPVPKLPKNMKKFKLNDIDPVEFARQLTITESRLYSQVKPHECLNKLWTVKAVAGGESEPAPNIRGLIRHSNQITNWVADLVLGPSELKKRVAVVKYFIAVAEQCKNLGNYSTLTSILAALGHSTIHRLNRTWNAVDKKSKETLGELDTIMHRSKNFANYREALHKCQPPCIPFVGIYLTDLIFIEEGIPSLIKNSDLVNFYKRTKTAEVIREIMAFQNIGYPFKTIPEIQSYIADKKEHAGNIHEMYNRSLKIEPREREDEKIARLLSESGFL